MLQGFGETVQNMLHKAGFHLSCLAEVPAVRRQQMLAYAQVGDLLDIGANVGQWAASARRYGYEDRIWSFEPASREYGICAVRARRDADWHVERCAVGDKPGTLPLRVAGNSLFSSFLPVSSRGLQSDPDAAEVRTEEVPVRTLDDIAAGLAGPLGVKMDVQGFEGRVLDGGEIALKSAVFLEMELSLISVYEDEPLYREMAGRLSGIGFRLAMVEPVWPDHVTGEALQFNGFFVRS